MTESKTSVDEARRIFEKEAESERHRGALGVIRDPLASSDMLRRPRGSLADLTMTQVMDGDLLKAMSWRDNEWGYAAQLVREGLRVPSS